jgi:hypothetical protein
MNFQELEEENLYWALQKAEGRKYRMDYEYNFHKVLFELINEYAIDVRWILFEERYDQYATWGNWMAGMFKYENNIPRWQTAYAKTPEIAIARVFIRCKLGDEIDVPKELV